MTADTRVLLHLPAEDEPLVLMMPAALVPDRGDELRFRDPRHPSLGVQCFWVRVKAFAYSELSPVPRGEGSDAPHAIVSDAMVVLWLRE